MTSAPRTRKPRSTTILAMVAALFLGQIAAACACIMQPGHAPASIHEAHQSHEHIGQDIPEHCIEPCVITASAELSSQQAKSVAKAIVTDNDLFAPTRVSEAANFERRRISRARVIEDPPPLIPDTLVRLHVLLLT